MKNVKQMFIISLWFLCDMWLNIFFRIFIGTRNVAGRSPVGSVAVDLDEWLNIKNFADIYFLGYMYDLDSL